jgi:hypothetical protein
MHSADFKAGTHVQLDTEAVVLADVQILLTQGGCDPPIPQIGRQLGAHGSLQAIEGQDTEQLLLGPLQTPRVPALH